MPVVLQMTDADCGAACLAMVLRWHRRRVTLNECRERLGIGRDGTSAWDLLSAAHGFGLQGRGHRVDLRSSAQLSQLDLPAVAHWEDAHFVVVESCSRRSVRLVDPALGRRVVAFDELRRSMSGVVLTFAVTQQPVTDQPRPAAEGHVDRSGVRAALSRMRTSLLGLLAVSLLLQVLGLSLPLAMTVMFDGIVPGREAELLPLVGLGILGLALTQLGLAHVRSSLVVAVQARADREVMTRLFSHLLSLPFAFFQQRGNGDLMQRLSSSIVLRELVTNQVVSALIDGGFLVLYLVLLATRDVPFALTTLAIACLQVLVVVTLNGRTLRLRHRQITAQAEAEGLLMETLTGIGSVKAMGAEQQVYDSWLRRYSVALRLDSAQNRLSAAVENVSATVRLAAPLLLLWLGVKRHFDGELSLGEMLGLQTLALAFLLPLGSLIASVQLMQSVVSHVQRLQDVLAAEPEVPGGPRPRSALVLRGHIELRDVSFRYGAAGPLALDRVSLRVSAGQKVAIVGRSGSGKSTLALLLTGLHTPDAGEIRYDGVPLEELDTAALRRQLGVVLQDSFLFRDTIRRNVALGDPDLPLERVQRAAALAGLHEDVQAMPLGYDTRVAERGQALSGGQRQRLALARALVGEPAVLLLDEATSSLDVVTERLVDENISALRCTRIVIAHRLSTVRDADLIVVLDQGRVVEQGRHEQLLARGGVYADLVLTQTLVDNSRPAAALPA